MAATGTTSTTTVGTPADGEQLRANVRARYGSIAAAVSRSVQPEACGSSCCDTAAGDPITGDLYDESQVGQLPTGAVRASLGCGNPTALTDLRAGDTVLDLGSGGGIDVLLSAKRVGPTGFAYGVDMTDEMLALARKNAAEHGVRNVAFLKGEIESIPLPDAGVDVVISNCVINLSSDKARVFREAYRVLKPSGRFAVSDVVVQGDLPPALRASMASWTGCIGGALDETTYRRLLADAGFGDVGVQVTRVYDAGALAAADQDAGESDGGCCGPADDAQRAAFGDFTAAGGRLVSAFVRAAKPAGV